MDFLLHFLTSYFGRSPENFCGFFLRICLKIALKMAGIFVDFSGLLEEKCQLIANSCESGLFSYLVLQWSSQKSIFDFKIVIFSTEVAFWKSSPESYFFVILDVFPTPKAPQKKVFGQGSIDSAWWKWFFWGEGRKQVLLFDAINALLACGVASLTTTGKKQEYTPPWKPSVLSFSGSRYHNHKPLAIGNCNLEVASFSRRNRNKIVVSQSQTEGVFSTHQRNYSLSSLIREDFPSNYCWKGLSTPSGELAQNH